MRTLVGLLLALAFAGCENQAIPNGQLGCSVPDHTCPPGFSCAADGRCWLPGTGPVGAAGLPSLTQWMSAGGGAVTHPTDRTRVGVTIDDQLVHGTTTGTGGATLNYSYLSTDTQ
jgi:hypothetical protein